MTEADPENPALGYNFKTWLQTPGQADCPDGPNCADGLNCAGGRDGQSFMNARQHPARGTTIRWINRLPTPAPGPIAPPNSRPSPESNSLRRTTPAQQLTNKHRRAGIR